MSNNDEFDWLGSSSDSESEIDWSSFDVSEEIQGSEVNEGVQSPDVNKRVQSSNSPKQVLDNKNKEKSAYQQTTSNRGRTSTPITDTGLPNPNNQMPKPHQHNQSSMTTTQIAAQNRANRSNQKGQYINPTPSNTTNQGTRGTQNTRPSNKQSSVEKPTRPKKSNKNKNTKIYLLIVFLLISIGIIGFFIYSSLGKKSISKPIDYTNSGKEVYNNFENLLHNFDATSVDDFVGTNKGDSYIAQEWAYVNGIEIRQDFIKSVLNTVTFSYPKIKDNNGNDVDSPMNNNEKLIVTIPDYSKIVDQMEKDRDYIQKLVKASGYTDKDYTYVDDMTNLLLQYYLELDEVPTTDVEIDLPISNGLISDDANLDDILFGSDAFHSMIAKFSQCSIGYTGFKDETYTEKEEQHNPEYDEWLKLFIQYFTADGGTYNPETGEFKGYENFHKGTSKWEPWYEYDENNVLQKNPDGTNKVKYYSVKREDGTDWIQPAETKMVDVEKHRQVEDKWEEEKVIQYNFIGTHYLQTSYSGEGSTVTRVGDGTIDATAGVGTSIITKVLCSDNKYHDVRVTLTGYWIGKDAISYFEKFSSKNRGLLADSEIQYIAYEVEVENLENTEISFDSEMTLADKNSNITARTGNMFGFKSSLTLKPHEKDILNDWASSTELDQKYVCWGKSFGRAYGLVYFNVLAGTGNIPTYSAYKQFTGDEGVSEDSNNESTTSDSENITDESID